MPIPAGPLPTPTVVRADLGKVGRPSQGTVTRPVAGTADPSKPGHVQ